MLIILFTPVLRALHSLYHFLLDCFMQHSPTPLATPCFLFWPQRCASGNLLVALCNSCHCFLLTLMEGHD